MIGTEIIAVADAAAATRQMGFGIAYHTLVRAAQNGDLEAEKLGGRWVTTRDSLAAFVEAKRGAHVA